MSETVPPPNAERRPTRITSQALVQVADCRRRLWLANHTRTPMAPLPEHVVVLRERAREHERAVADRFTDLAGPFWKHDGPLSEVAAETLHLLRETRRPIWRGALLSADGRRVAHPGFLSWEGDSLIVTEARLALRPDARADFALQLAHVRDLLFETAGLVPARFDIVNGEGETLVVEPATDARYASVVRAVDATLAEPEEPTELRAYSNCRRCPYYDHCWDMAERDRRIELLPEVQIAHVPEYHALGVHTLADLVTLDPERLPAGPVRGAAKHAIVVASAWIENRAAWLQPPLLPKGPLVWFDLEGDSLGEKAENPIYLWGLALELPGEAPVAEAIVAEMGADGDREAWERFVARAVAILDQHPDARFVHWDAFEPLWIERYALKLGAPDGFVKRMKSACHDLKRVLDRCVRLPLRSYSIKHVAPWMGFEWRNPESGSEWSVAQFHRARETDDPVERERLVTALVEYNEDDLWAMRAVWRWLAEHAPRGA
ncbi:MAG: TM0106 family RecB-like putative nuclease [Candidatus Eisenbacteria bacterium]|nr:TM0106 family RecB-like putative nuclease [Candidatus Eisenbacteria bacterium]